MQTTTAEKTETPKILTWEERVKELEDLGATRSDAQAVIDAEDSVNEGMKLETFSFNMQMNRQERLDQARKTMEQRAHGLLD